MTIAQVGNSKSVGAADNGASTTVATVGLLTTTGNALIVCARHEDGPLPDSTTCAFTDTAGNTYVPLGSLSLSSGGETERIYVAYCLSITGNVANIVTATFSNSRSFRRSIASEYSHSSPLSLRDQNTGSSSSGVTSISIGNMTAVTGDLAIGVFGNYDSGPQFSAGSGYTAREDGNLTFLVHLIDQVMSSGGTVSPNGTFNSADTYVGIGAVFTESGGGGAAARPNLLLMGCG